MRKILTVVIFGIPIAAVSLDQISLIIISLIKSRKKSDFFYVNAHCLNIANKDKEYKRILQKATLVYSGGFGPVLASRILGRPLYERTPTPDFIENIFLIAQKKNWSIYLLGGEHGIAGKAAANLKKRFPYLVIAGYHHGFFRKNSKIIEKINRAKPDIVLVGMGTPRQERWIADNMDTVKSRVFWAVGALFDILSDKRKRAPKWMQELGLEWAFRLLQEPRRLWRRYVFGNIRFVINVLGQSTFFRKTSR